VGCGAQRFLPVFTGRRASEFILPLCFREGNDLQTGRGIFLVPLSDSSSRSPDRDQRSERRWLGFVVSQVRKSGPGISSNLGRKFRSQTDLPRRSKSCWTLSIVVSPPIAFSRTALNRLLNNRKRETLIFDAAAPTAIPR